VNVPYSLDCHCLTQPWRFSRKSIAMRLGHAIPQ
jgi:hypothetical protein